MSASTAKAPTERLVTELSSVFGRTAMLARPPDDGPALTLMQRLALMELATAEPLRLHELAERIGSSPPTASRAVDGLLEAALVERVPDPDDRRAVQIHLSDYGRGRIAEGRARVAATLEPALATLGERDREQLIGLLARLNLALAQ